MVCGFKRFAGVERDYLHAFRLNICRPAFMDMCAHGGYGFQEIYIEVIVVRVGIDYVGDCARIRDMLHCVGRAVYQQAAVYKRAGERAELFAAAHPVGRARTQEFYLHKVDPFRARIYALILMTILYSARAPLSNAYAAVFLARTTFLLDKNRI